MVGAIKQEWVLPLARLASPHPLGFIAAAAHHTFTHHRRRA